MGDLVIQSNCLWEVSFASHSFMGVCRSKSEKQLEGWILTRGDMGSNLSLAKRSMGDPAPVTISLPNLLHTVVVKKKRIA